MNPLAISFAGLQLDNPIIVSSSGLTDTADKCRDLEEAGAGAIVLKSIFEEQIMEQYHHYNDPTNAEGSDYLSAYLRSHALNESIELIKAAKRLCTIPIIASINCTSASEWTNFAETVEQAGADAIEINIMEIQISKDYQYGAYEQKHIDILQAVKSHTKLPIIMKLGQNMTNPVALVNQLYANGAAAVVMFNRFYRPDINIETDHLVAGEMCTRPSDICDSLRWVGISSAAIPQIDYAEIGRAHV